MRSIPPRLFWHSAVGALLVAGGVMSPLMLLFKEVLGDLSVVVGVLLLAMMCGAVLASFIVRLIEGSAFPHWRWRCVIAAAWLLNPVMMVTMFELLGSRTAAWWSGMPLCVVLMVLSGRVQLIPHGPSWGAPCPWSVLRVCRWLLNRIIWLGTPFYLLSLQFTIWLPKSNMLPTGPEMSLFVCGGCLLCSAKFCAMCASLVSGPEGSPRLTQALLLVICLAADFMGLFDMIMHASMTDATKESFMLSLLLAGGLLQVRYTFVRLRLFSRWRKHIAQSRASARQLGVDCELGSDLAPGGGESSDSDDDQGPGGVPTGFHESLVCILGIPPVETRREWLCGPRRALVQQPPPVMPDLEQSKAQLPADVLSHSAPPDATTEASGNAGTGASAATSGQTATAAGTSTSVHPEFNIIREERVCTVCQDEIRDGETVRPMPKCTHVFHAQCLEGWAAVKQTSTRCPTCRRPALLKKPSEGATPVSSLVREAPQRSTRPRGTQVGGAHIVRARRQAAQARMATARRPALGLNRRPAVAALCSVLNLSESLAEASLDCTSGAVDEAADLIWEFRAFIIERPRERIFSRASGSLIGARNMSQAMCNENGPFEGLIIELNGYVMSLLRSGCLHLVDWERASADQQLQTYRILLSEFAELLRR